MTFFFKVQQVYIKLVLIYVCVADTHSHHSSCFHSRVWPRRHSAGHDRWDRGARQVRDRPRLLTLAAPVEWTEASPSCRWRMPPYWQTIVHILQIHTCFFMFRGYFGQREKVLREGRYFRHIDLTSGCWWAQTGCWDRHRLWHFIWSLAYCLYENSQSSRLYLQELIKSNWICCFILILYLFFWLVGSPKNTVVNPVPMFLAVIDTPDHYYVLLLRQ